MSSPRASGGLAEPVGDGGQDDVVERPAQALAHLLYVVDRGRGPGVAPVGADGYVEARHRGGPHQAGHGRHAPPDLGCLGPARGGWRPGGWHGAPAPARRGSAPRSSAPPSPAAPPGRGGPGGPRRAGQPTRRGEVHDHREQVRPRHAVDHGVMGLGTHGPAPILQALDHPDLPQRPRPVECWDMTRPTSLRSSASTPRRRQRRVAEVVLDVEVGVVHPHRPAEVEGDEPTTWR